MTERRDPDSEPGIEERPGRPGPEAMREAVAGYVQEIHRAYVDQAATFSPGVRGRMPLLTAGRLTVAAVAARNLHLLATAEPLGPLRGQEVAMEAEYDGLSWQLRFFDPVVLPVLGLVAETDGPAPEEVRRVLGVGTYLYHLVVEPGSQLTPHHATHAGTGLASAHATAARELETIRAHAPGRQELVDELAGATTAGLVRAQALLARELAPGDPAVAAATDPAAIRAALVKALKGGLWTTERTPAPGRLRSPSGGPGTGGPG